MNVASTAPVTTAITPLAPTAQNRRHSGVRRWISVSASTTSIGWRLRAHLLPRAEGAVALAGFRHPAAINATIARPAIQAESVVSSVIDTQQQMVPTPTPPVRTPSTKHRWWAMPMAGLAFLALVGLLVLSVLPATLRARTDDGQDAQFAIVPSEAEPVAARLAFDAVERYPADGSILFVTIREPEITLLDWYISRGLGEVDLLSYTDKFGEQTPDQQRQFSVEMMRSAKETAEYVALHQLGYPAEIVPGAIIVADVIPDTSAADVLQPGDTLLKVAGVDVATIDDLAPALGDRQPGDVVTVEYDRPGEGQQSGDIELIASNDGTGRTIIGFERFDTATADLPFTVDIDSGAIGGPSAGLAFTLTLIDELTPGELTGDRQVAVTGTIEIDGTVGAIGGLVSKTSAVKQRGAKIFIVPSAQGAENIAAARAVAGDELTIIPVDDVPGALAALAEYGGNGLELGTPGTQYVAPS
jgi:PDZ domain-containing protein